MKRLFVLLTVFTALAMPAFAQKETPKIQPYVDWRMFHLGFYLGLHAQDLILSHSGKTGPGGETWFAEIPSYTPGFSVGIIGDMFVNPYLNLRILPSLHFGDKQFVFRASETGNEYLTTVRSNYLTFPLEFKYSSLRLNNYRPYITAGVYGAFDLGRKKSEPLLLKGADYGLTVGVGCDLYFPFFKLCPELKFHFGLTNLIEKERPDLSQPALGVYSNAISRAASRMIVLSFNFE